MKLYQVDIEEVPADPIELVRALRVVGRMSLADARDVQELLTASGGGTVVAGVERPVAEHIAQALAGAGARTSVVESSVRSPSRCDPAAATRFVWNKFRSLEAA